MPGILDQVEVESIFRIDSWVLRKHVVNLRDAPGEIGSFV